MILYLDSESQTVVVFAVGYLRPDDTTTSPPRLREPRSPIVEVVDEAAHELQSSVLRRRTGYFTVYRMRISP